jgi:hypothetical protein
MASQAMDINCSSGPLVLAPKKRNKAGRVCDSGISSGED